MPASPKTSPTEECEAVMRMPVVVVASLASLASLALVMVACAPEPAAGDTCAKASRIVSECGASLPALEGECSATKRAIATCITKNGADCEALATLYQRLDVCVADLVDAGDLAQADVPEPITLAPRDAGKDAAKSTPPSSSSPSSSSSSSSGGDAATAPDAALDAGPATWPGLLVSGTIAQGVSRYFVTGVLEPGTYHFTLTGTGDADLYVRKGAAPNTTTFDCRPFVLGSDESCDVTISGNPIEVHVMLRGVAASSSFTLKGQP